MCEQGLKYVLMRNHIDRLPRKEGPMWFLCYLFGWIVTRHWA